MYNNISMSDSLMINPSLDLSLLSTMLDIFIYCIRTYSVELRIAIRKI